MTIKQLTMWGILGATILAAVLALTGTFYIVDEGHVAVVKYTGKAVRQEGPGLQTKLPIFEDYVVIEVRERKNVERLSVATRDRLPAVADVSFNWTVDVDSAIDLYKQYGGLKQFEDRVLSPRFRAAAKTAIAHYDAASIIKDRATVTAEIKAELEEATSALPIGITIVAFENISLPQTYIDAILAKEQAREDAEKENHNLAKQKLVAQQAVQTATAEADAVKARADGDAYKVKVAADAAAYEKQVGADAESYRVLTEYTGRAEGVAKLNKELTPDYIAYLRAQGWDGKLPSTMLGDGGSASILLGLNTR